MRTNVLRIITWNFLRRQTCLTEYFQFHLKTKFQWTVGTMTARVYRKWDFLNYSLNSHTDAHLPVTPFLFLSVPFLFGRRTQVLSLLQLFPSSFQHSSLHRSWQPGNEGGHQPYAPAFGGTKIRNRCYTRESILFPRSHSYNRNSKAKLWCMRHTDCFKISLLFLYYLSFFRTLGICMSFPPKLTESNKTCSSGRIL